MTTALNTRDRLTYVMTSWATLWNGRYDLVDELVAPDFAIWFGSTPGAGADITNPAALREFVVGFRDQFPDARFSSGECVVDEVAGRGALLWTLRNFSDDGRVGDVSGVDQFSFVGGQITRAWSMTGSWARAF